MAQDTARNWHMRWLKTGQNLASTGLYVPCSLDNAYLVRVWCVESHKVARKSLTKPYGWP